MYYNYILTDFRKNHHLTSLMSPSIVLKLQEIWDILHYFTHVDTECLGLKGLTLDIRASFVLRIKLSWITLKFSNELEPSSVSQPVPEITSMRKSLSTCKTFVTPAANLEFKLARPTLIWGICHHLDNCMAVGWF